MRFLSLVLSLWECLISGLTYYVSLMVCLLSSNTMILRFIQLLYVLVINSLFLNLLTREATTVRRWKPGMPSLWLLTTCNFRNKAGLLEPSSSTSTKLMTLLQKIPHLHSYRTIQWGPLSHFCLLKLMQVTQLVKISNESKSLHDKEPEKRIFTFPASIAQEDISEKG